MGTKLFSDIITFTRASSATRVNSSGLVETVASNQPRFDYDSSTLQPKGLLVEEQRTNLVTYSEQFDTAAWTKSNSSIATNVISAPDGFITADKLVENTASAIGHFIQPNPVISLTAGQAIAYSVYAKASERSFLQIVHTGIGPGGANLIAGFDLVNGTAGAPSSGVTSSIISFGNGWYRCCLMATVSTTASSTAQIRLALNSSSSPSTYTGDGVSGVYIWGAQLEVGAFPTSYIPTTTSAATRAADVATITGSNFSSWYRQDEGTLFAEFGPYADGGATRNPGVVQIDDTSTNSYVRIFAGSTVYPVYSVSVSGTIQAYLSTGILNPASVSEIAGAYKVNDFARSYNGTTAITDTSGTPSTVNRMLIGTGTGGVYDACGHLRRITYYPRRLTDAELQALTA